MFAADEYRAGLYNHSRNSFHGYVKLNSNPPECEKVVFQRSARTNVDAPLNEPCTAAHTPSTTCEQQVDAYRLTIGHEHW